MHRYLFFTVFVSGMTTLAIELSAARLLGNVFGASNLIWATIIGLMLIYLTIGYFIGGRWADRSPRYETMYTILAWGAFTIGVVPLIANPVLHAAATAFDGLVLSVMAGSFATVLILFLVPITLLGMTSPFAIRLLIDKTQSAGAVAGSVYAISTLGSFIGTFLPVLILIPNIGTTKTFYFFSVLLLLVALAGFLVSGHKKLAIRYSLLLLLLAVLAFFAINDPIKTSAGQIYEGESAYNYIQVIEHDSYRYLRLNDGQGVHSAYHPDHLAYGGPWELFLIAPFFNEAGHGLEQVQSMAIVGLAAGTTARQATAVFGPIAIDGYEIDPKIVQVGREYFEMTMPNLSVAIQDGRYGLSASTNRYDIIGVDAYRPPYIPWHMTTREFFQITYDRLTEDGVLVINVGRLPNDRRLIDGLATTIAAIYPSVHIVDIPNTLNSMIFATRQPTQSSNLVFNFTELAAGNTHPLLLQAMQTAIVNLQPGYQSTTVFTDDLAPIEWITNNMIMNFILHGDMAGLQ